MTHLFDYDDVRSQRPRERLKQKLNILLSEGAVEIADSFEECDFGFYRDCGILGFKF